jgi:hypothetical protein
VWQGRAGRLSQTGINRLDRSQPYGLTRTEVTQRRLEVRRELTESADQGIIDRFELPPGQ